MAPHSIPRTQGWGGWPATDDVPVAACSCHISSWYYICCLFTGVSYEFKGLLNPEIDLPSPHPLRVLPVVREGLAHPVQERQKKLQRGQTHSGNGKHWVKLINPSKGLDFFACVGSSTARLVSSRDQSSWDLLVTLRQGSGNRAGAVAPSGVELGLCMRLLLYPRHAIPFLAD